MTGTSQTHEDVPPGPDGDRDVAAVEMTPSWKPPRGYVAAVALLVAVGMALAALTLAFASRAGDEGEDDVRRTAGEFSTALLTYDYGKLDEAKARVLSFATGGFKQQYEQAMAGGLDVILQETQARSAVHNVEVYVSEVEDSTASAIAVADTVVEGKSGRRQVQHYVQLELVKVAGAWKVTALLNLKLGEPVDAAVPGAAPTTAPARPPK